MDHDIAQRLLASIMLDFLPTIFIGNYTFLNLRDSMQLNSLRFHNFWYSQNIKSIKSLK